MSNIDFKYLVELLLTEQNVSEQSLYQYIINLLQTIPEYKLAIPNEINEETFVQNLIDLGWRIKYGTGYNSATNSEIARYRSFWPIVDFVIDVLSNVKTRDLKEIDFNQNLNTILTKIGKDNINVDTLVKTAQTLNAPNAYTIKDRRINDIKFSTGSLAGEGYKNKTPLNAVIDAIRVVKGYNENDVNDIMKFPRKYDLPATIKLTELMPIRRISQALYIFYVNKLKNSLYLNVLQTLVPEFANKNIEEITNIIDKSVGQTNPQSRSLQEDYINFLSGKSKLLVKLIQENIDNLTAVVLNELSRDEIAAGERRTYQDPNKQSLPQKSQTQQKSWKPTNTPLITTINDFKQGAGIDQQVEDAYNDFYNSLTKGSVPTKWQKTGNMFSSFLKGLEDIGSTLERL